MCTQYVCVSTQELCAVFVHITYLSCLHNIFLTAPLPTYMYFIHHVLINGEFCYTSDIQYIHKELLHIVQLC